MDFDDQLLTVSKELCTDETVEHVLYLLDRGANIDKVDIEGNTPIMNIIKQYTPSFRYNSLATVKMIKTMLLNKASLHNRNNRGENIYHNCSRLNVESPLEMILESTEPDISDINAKDNNSQSPLLIACSLNNLDIVQLLVDNKADINQSDDNGNTSLHAATDVFQLMTYLVQNGGNPCLKNKQGNTPLFLCDGIVCSGFFKYLWDKTDMLFQVNTLNCKGENLFHIICKSRQTLLFTPLFNNVLLLVQDVNLQDYQGQTALILLQKHGCVAFTRHLIKRGADPNIEDMHNCTAVDYAFQYAHKSRNHLLNLRYFIEHFTDKFVNCKIIKKKQYSDYNDHGQTLFHYACQWNNINLVRNIIAEGYNVFLNTSNNQTVVELIQEQLFIEPFYNTDIIQELMNCGININETTTGLTLLHSLCLRNHTFIHEQEIAFARSLFSLLTYGCEVNPSTSCYELPIYYIIHSKLHTAAAYSKMTQWKPTVYNDLVGMLLSAGSKVPTLAAATQNPHIPFIKLLLSYFENYGHQNLLINLPNEQVAEENNNNFDCLSLKLMTSCVIRTQLKPNAWVAVKKLPLPTTLKEYIRLGYKEYSSKYNMVL